ncbi:MAG: phosphoribosyltransferase family protein [Balneolaceae bacterium]|nr:phosphoribosyltransferase family protein [Balneolaceae bacterium]
MTESPELVYMDQPRVERTLKRMAYQISEQNRKDREILLLGIEQRGSVIARQLKQYLEEIYDRSFHMLQIGEEAISEQEIETVPPPQTFPVVVDDVIFTGRTMFSALKRIHEVTAFGQMYTAVLVDRGHRSFPVQAQFVGMKLSTKLREHVSVRIEDDHVEQVVLEIS